MVYHVDELKTVDKQTAMQVFAEVFVKNGGNAGHALKVAGYSHRSVSQMASKLLANPKCQQFIKEAQTRLLCGEMTNKALSVLKEIMDDERAPASARVDCAKTILDRAGIGKNVSQSDLNIKPVQQMTQAELLSIINNYPKLIKELEQPIEGEIIEND